jgi:oleate hydratase
MREKSKAHLAGGGIGSLAPAAFIIRDGNRPGEHISLLQATPMMGGNLDGAGNHAGGYSLRGRHMLTTDNDKYKGDRYKSILLLHNKSTMVFDETVKFSVTS